MVVITEVGDGTNTLFWKDKWLDGHSIQDLAPWVFALVSNRRANKRTVREALTNEKWLEDIQGAISVEGLLEFLEVWDLISLVELQVGTPDKHIWRLSNSGEYSAKSAYEVLFQGAVYFRPAERIWKSHAPPKCRFFMWLVAHNRCWTADRLARRGLPHPTSCLLCDQEEENIQHLLVGCVFSRQFWFSLFQRFGLTALAPQPQDICFDDWWEKVEASVAGDLRQGLNSLVILGAWSIWRHRNNCVFNGASPSVAAAIALAFEEAHLWSLAGARGLTLLAIQGEG